MNESLGRLHLLSNYDEITSLPSLSTFRQHLDELLIGKHNRDKKSAIVEIDIQRFHLITDSLGWNAGNVLLELFAKRLVEVLGTHQTICRINADVFAFYCEAPAQSDSLNEHIYDYVLNELRRPFYVDGNELRLAFKYGITIFPDHGESSDTLLRNAEMALAKAKNSGDRYVVYSPAMHARASELLNLENKLRNAVANGQFVLYYQPKYDIVGKKLLGMEALLRWDSPELGRVLPGEFIPILEETQLIVDVGKWVVQQVAKDCHKWRDKQLFSIPRIAINISPQQLCQPDFMQQIALAHNAGVPLDLEITESTIMEHIDTQLDNLTADKYLGIGIEIDDFGTGYSSLSYIANLPVTGLKIDRSFITHISESNGSKIVARIIGLGRSLGLKVTAEGVETKEQWMLLQDYKCDALQGYLFGRPMPALQIENLF